VGSAPLDDSDEINVAGRIEVEYGSESKRFRLLDHLRPDFGGSGDARLTQAGIDQFSDVSTAAWVSLMRSLLSNGSPSATANSAASVDFPVAGSPFTKTTMRGTGVTVLRRVPEVDGSRAAALCLAVRPVVAVVVAVVPFSPCLGWLG
jgi:hypothetical protein